MNRSTRNILVFCLLSFILCLSSCRPHGILSSRKMRDIMIDLHKTDALLFVTGLQMGKEEVNNIYYAEVLEKHGVTQAQFDSSLVWYTAHPQLFDKIYPKVLKELKAQEEAFIALHEAELHMVPDEEVSCEGLEVSEFTHAQLDSVLWVTQHGYPHSWNPLVHDFVNELFPQIGVLR